MIYKLCALKKNTVTALNISHFILYSVLCYDLYKIVCYDLYKIWVPV